MRSVLVLLLSAVVLALRCDDASSFAFPTTTRPPRPVTWSPTTTTRLDAKKKRRRRRQDPSSNDDPSSSDDDGDELPDFDIDNPDEAPEPKKRKNKGTTPSAAAAAQQVIGKTPEGEEITAAMMSGGNDPSSRSVRDLLNDRSLERRVDFDDESMTATTEEELPDLMRMARERNGGGDNAMTDAGQGMSKKKARQAARRAAAAARQEEEEEEASLQKLLGGIPFLLNEKGQVTGVKILEAGTWTGIGLLVVWEIYINSPLFDRAAPMAPVVY